MKWENILSDINERKAAVQTTLSEVRRDPKAVRGLVIRHKFAVGACAAAAIAGAVFLTRPAPADQSAQPAPDLPKVVATAVKMERLAPEIPLAGTVVSRNDSHLAADVEGRVAWVADVGTVVNAGDVVARLDNSVAGMQASSDSANVARLQAQMRYDRSQADRMQSLYSQNAIAKATRDQAISSRDMDAGALAQAESALKKSRYNFDHDDIRAPFPGRVVARLINPGEYASAGKEVVRLVDISSLEVSAQAPIQISQFLKEGTKITSYIEDKPVVGTLRALVPVGDLLSRTVEIRLTIDSGAAFVGDSAKVMVPSSAPRMALAVPRDALLLREDNTYLFKLDKNNTALRVAVETGTTDGNLIEVHGQIAPGERVIIRGAEHLEAGQKVRVSAS
jgi:RND family efflux transporter MFP subunit